MSLYDERFHGESFLSVFFLFKSSHWVSGVIKLRQGKSVPRGTPHFMGEKDRFFPESGGDFSLIRKKRFFERIFT